MVRTRRRDRSSEAHRRDRRRLERSSFSLQGARLDLGWGRDRGRDLSGCWGRRCIKPRPECSRRAALCHASKSRHQAPCRGTRRRSEALLKESERTNRTAACVSRGNAANASLRAGPSGSTAPFTSSVVLVTRHARRARFGREGLLAESLRRERIQSRGTEQQGRKWRPSSSLRPFGRPGDETPTRGAAARRRSVARSSRASSTRLRGRLRRPPGDSGVWQKKPAPLPTVCGEQKRRRTRPRSVRTVRVANEMAKGGSVASPCYPGPRRVCGIALDRGRMRRATLRAGCLIDT